MAASLILVLRDTPVRGKSLIGAYFKTHRVAYVSCRSMLDLAIKKKTGGIDRATRLQVEDLDEAQAYFLFCRLKSGDVNQDVLVDGNALLEESFASQCHVLDKMAPDGIVLVLDRPKSGRKNFQSSDQLRAVGLVLEYLGRVVVPYKFVFRHDREDFAKKIDEILALRGATSADPEPNL
ncbi:MAG: hypothetical protein K2X57_29085 [Xanthobacteraceae bacterium]|nr:hypothetical protein [Xanthobacteraceae bacterium]